MGHLSNPASNALIYVTYAAFLSVPRLLLLRRKYTDLRRVSGCYIAWLYRKQPKSDFLHSNRTQTGSYTGSRRPPPPFPSSIMSCADHRAHQQSLWRSTLSHLVSARNPEYHAPKRQHTHKFKRHTHTTHMQQSDKVSRRFVTNPECRHLRRWRGRPRSHYGRLERNSK